LIANFREFLQRYCRDITEHGRKISVTDSQVLQRYCGDIAYKFQTNFAETVQRYCRAGAEIFQTHLSDMRSYCRAGAEIFQAVIADIYREIAELMQRYYGDVSGSFC
jgi:predicted SpoU family rRNA methylase